MDCIICGQAVVNENNRLQKKVSTFWKTNSELDVKHQWIKQWKICYDCSEKYTNDMLIGDTKLQQKIKEQARYKKQQQEALHYNREPKLSQVEQSYYIDKYIDYATDKAMENGENIAKSPFLKKGHQYDAAYIAYVERSESTAVFIVRDLAETIDTKGKWIDVRLMEKRFLSNHDADFSFIIVELFQRKQTPNFPNKTAEETDSEYKNRVAYITWQTATADITSQRAQGIKGEVYIVLPCLKDEHEGILEKHYIAWNPMRRHYKRVQKSNQTVKIIKPPKWGYSIMAIKKMNHQQLSYIERNLNQIIGKTHEKREVTLTMFSPQKKHPVSKMKTADKGNKTDGVR